MRTRFFTNQDALAQLIADVYAGKLHPRVAAGLAPLVGCAQFILRERKAAFRSAWSRILKSFFGTPTLSELRFFAANLTRSGAV